MHAGAFFIFKNFDKTKRLSVCLSVRLSHMCIVTKRNKRVFRFLCHIKDRSS